jgi:hypothetical protein
MVVVVAAPEWLPPDQVKVLPVGMVRLPVPASTPAERLRVLTRESGSPTWGVRVRVPPETVNGFWLSRSLIVVDPVEKVTWVPGAPLAMHTWSPAPGTPSGLQLAASCQESVAAPRSQVFVATSQLLAAWTGPSRKRMASMPMTIAGRPSLENVRAQLPFCALVSLIRRRR